MKPTEKKKPKEGTKNSTDKNLKYIIKNGTDAQRKKAKVMIAYLHKKRKAKKKNKD